MKIYWFALFFRDIFERKLPSKQGGQGVCGGDVDKGQVPKDQQSPCFKEMAADSLIISGYLGDRPRIYSFPCTWHSSTCGGGCQGPFG